MSNIIVWSGEHTLGHIAISADNPIAKYFKKESDINVKLPCDLVDAGKFRNGAKRYWCRTHQIHFGVKGDDVRGACRSAEMLLDYCTNPLELDINKYQGGVGVWAALPPAIDTNNEPFSVGVHVHCRETSGGKKQIDKTFRAIRVRVSDSLGINYDWIDITPPAAIALLEAKVKNISLDVASCSYCHAKHLDLGDFQRKAHKKHLCGNCGRDFWVKSPIVSNPLLEIERYFEGFGVRKSEQAKEIISLKSDDFSKLKIWASTPAILWTVNQPEVVGIHVHAWRNSEQIIDETFGDVILDGTKLDRETLLNKMLHYSFLNPK